MNLIPVDGATITNSPNPDIVLGSAPPSPTISEQAALPPPIPPTAAPAPAPVAHPTASTLAPPISASTYNQPTPPHLSSPSLPTLPPKDVLATSLQQLSGEAAFLPRSAVERTPSNTLYPHGNNPDLSLQPAAAPMSRQPTELYIPGLMSTSLFVLLPVTDSLTPIIEKYLPPNQRPPRDLSGAWRGRTLDQLIASRSWRAIAEYCHDSIMEASPEQTSYLLSLWSLRLQCLLRLHLIEHLTTELSALFALLPPSTYLAFAPPPPSPESPRFHPAVPFELHILLASLHGLRGERERTVESLAAVLRSIKEEMWAAKRKGEEGEREEKAWRERAERVGGILMSVLTDLRAAPSATTLISSSSSYATSPSLLQALTRLHVSTGDLDSLSVSSAALEALPSPEGPSRIVRKARALAKVARGEWADAEADWRALVEEDKEDAEAVNNLSVVLLFSSKLSEAIRVLTTLLSSNPAKGYSSETILFNLATLLELRTEQALPAKLELLRGAIEHGGESLRGSCLKLSV
ncbi:hypothetical protein BCR35DRAFT_308627 [Leucosporidium creatinivorum]|uniref:Tetratricopeptide repeat-domain-containing protein n=1 Tax=Leucosporidium creatinivorum TaxID=106004 RepID=A0A1Y2DZM7_9BASI|nr:hypothetical protein BCR35DRAFT_308627 [Leucosporidium creatinivorum]